MDRATILLNDLRARFQRTHVERLRRALYANVTVEVGTGGEFTIVVQPLKASLSSFKKSFTREFVFAGTYHLSPEAWAVQKRACDYTQDIVREVLEQRGIT